MKAVPSNLPILWVSLHTISSNDAKNLPSGLQQLKCLFLEENAPLPSSLISLEFDAHQTSKQIILHSNLTNLHNLYVHIDKIEKANFPTSLRSLKLSKPGVSMHLSPNFLQYVSHILYSTKNSFSSFLPSSLTSLDIDAGNISHDDFPFLPPSLKRLTLKRCHCIRSISGLPPLEYLEIESSNILQVELPKSLQVLKFNAVSPKPIDELPKLT